MIKAMVKPKREIEREGKFVPLDQGRLKITAKATISGGGSSISLPKSWRGKMVVCMLEEHFNQILKEMEKEVKVTDD
jgi:hypothetical protein